MWDNTTAPAPTGLLASRTPGMRNGGSTIGQYDRPFLDLAGVGHLPASGDPVTAAGDPQTYPPLGPPPLGGNPIGRGLEDTIFRLQTPSGQANGLRLFQVQGTQHPYLKNDMLTKVYNNLT